MRILVTGTTLRITGEMRRKPMIRRAAVIEEVVRTLAIGHKVDQRSVGIGEDLTAYDAIWLGVTAPLSVVAPTAPGTFWALAHAVDKGIPIVVAFDDWQIGQIFSGFRRVGRYGVEKVIDFYAKHKIVQRTYGPSFADDMRANAVMIEVMCRDFDSGVSDLWQQAVLGLKLFDGWGDARRITEKWMVHSADVTAMRFDPTPWYLPEFKNTPIEWPAERQRRWVLAGLMDAHLNWAARQKVTWPVDSYGPGKRSIEVLQGEAAVMQKYAESWGVLVPRYPHEGSGWFRPRWLTAAMAGAVVLCSKEDGAALGTPYQFTAPHIETASDEWLEITAAAQKQVLTSKIQTDPRESRAQLLNMIDAAVALARG